MSEAQTTLASANIDEGNTVERRRELSRVTGGVDLDAEFDAALARCESLEDAARVLYHLLHGGYSIWTNGKLYCIRELVGRIGALRIEIRFNEHAPPHFHVRAGRDIDASFAILDCALLAGRLPPRQHDLIERWYAGERALLIREWNRTRPSDCPVGPIREEA